MSTTQPDTVILPSHGTLETAGRKILQPAGSAVVGSEKTVWTRPAVTTRNVRKLWRRRAAVVLALVVVVVGGYAGVTRLGRSARAEDVQLFSVTRRSFPVVLQERGELLADNTNDIRCELQGKSTLIWLIDEGTYVKKGDKLVELASDETDEKLRDAEIKVATAQAEYEAALKGLQILVDKNASEIRKAGVKLWLAEQALKKYQKGEAVKSRQDAELALEKATSLLKQAREKRQDSEELFTKEYITKYDLEMDRVAESSAEIELKTARLTLEILDTYTIPMDLAQKQSEIDDTTKELDRARKEAQATEAKDKALAAAKESELKLNRDKLIKLQDQKKKAIILAPSDGLVVYARDRDFGSGGKLKTGVVVYERQKLLELPDTSTMKVKIRIHEAKAEQLRLGLTATVEIEGLSGQVFTGKVSKIAALADSQDWMNENIKEYRTEVLLDGKFVILKPNTSATVQVLVTELSNVLAVPVQSVFSKGDRHYVFVEDGGEIRPTEVQVGLSSIEYVEIKTGLKENQQVRLAVSDEMKLKLGDDDGRSKGSKTPATTRPGQGVQATQPTSRPTTQASTRPTTQPHSASTRPAVAVR